MLVETYEATEVDADNTPECDAEAIALIEQLGLEGQRKLVKGDGEQKTRCPYRKMTAEERRIYEAIFGQKTALKRYADAPIPVRVLQVAAHANELFDTVEVWHPESADETDPILVGINGGEYSSTREWFILARWGDVLLPWNELVTKAVKIMREDFATNLNDMISRAQAKLKVLDAVGDTVLMAGKFKVPSIQSYQWE